MEDFIAEIITALLTSLLFWAFQKFFPIGLYEKTVDFDAVECAKLSTKNTMGCCLNIILIGTLITLLYPVFWLPLFEYIHDAKDAIYIVRPTLINTAIISLYLALPLSIIVTNNWFSRKYGINKALELYSYHDSISHFSNLKLGKWLYNISAGFSFIVVFYYFSNVTILTANDIRYTNPFGFYSHKEKIEDVEKIEYYTGSIAPNGNIVGFDFYVVHFKNKNKWKALGNDDILVKVVKTVVQQKGIKIENKGIEQ